MVQTGTFLSLLALASLAVTHPGVHEHHNFAKRQAFSAHATRSLSSCSDSLAARGLNERSIARRQALAADIRKRNNIKARDLDTVLATDHASNLTGITVDSDPSLLFSGNASCLLDPEVTQGPYYVSGEYVRKDMRETQEGVDLYADVQLIDVNTCEPVSGAYLEWWHANATGVYSGIVASGNGDSSDESNLDNTFLRGIQSSDEDGVVQFLSIFPGHYTSRATHVHVIAQLNATVQANNTITGYSSSHVGQIFFDQDLITEVEAVEPYNTNTQEITENADDQILSEEAADIDPMMNYVLLGDSVADGVLGWIVVGIDTSANYTISPAATLTENGGVENENSGMGGGDAPSGSGMPSGAAPSSSSA